MSVYLFILILYILSFLISLVSGSYWEAFLIFIIIGYAYDEYRQKRSGR